ncbi:hypothetical protein QJS04_geneDACA010338 [Acorus gramineus]|uniref:SRR1-like domain-containing protein n=1 Tax=Acorus gramineus TaxID=55184 RepID=A0AAV9A6M1_ACOGR|nr:hypothetical protein QJS04_geneDACA010338 [Acorus gramineus]
MMYLPKKITCKRRPLEALMRGDWKSVFPDSQGKFYYPIPIYESDPKKWTPVDTETVDPTRESNLHQEMLNSLKRVRSSKFYLRFLHTLQTSPPIQRFLNNLLSIQDESTTMVLYGIGRIESDALSRLQLSLAILLVHRLGIDRLEVFDPVLSLTECDVMTSFGCDVLSFDEHCKRAVKSPTLFFMPHCPSWMYDYLLRANWSSASQLNMVAVLGNRFRRYATRAKVVDLEALKLAAWGEVVEARRDGREKPRAMTAVVNEVLDRVRYGYQVGPCLKEAGEVLVTEVRMVVAMTRRGGGGGDEEEFNRAFSDLTWHGFEVEDDMALVELPPARDYEDSFVSRLNSLYLAENLQRRINISLVGPKKFTKSNWTQDPLQQLTKTNSWKGGNDGLNPGSPLQSGCISTTALASGGELQRSRGKENSEENELKD